MKQIPLDEKHSVLVDDEDYEYISSFKCHLMKSIFTNYASFSYYGKTTLIHRFIMEPPDGLEVDHIDGNGLNNQKSNLRVVTHEENAKNRHKSHNIHFKACENIRVVESSAWCLQKSKCPKNRLKGNITATCWKVRV